MIFKAGRKALFSEPVAHLNIGYSVFILVHWQVGLCYCRG